MAGAKMTPAQAKALAEAGKWFGDPKLGKQRIKDFGKMIAGNAASMSGAPMNDKRVNTSSVRANAAKYGPQLPTGAKSKPASPTKRPTPATKRPNRGAR